MSYDEDYEHQRQLEMEYEESAAWDDYLHEQEIEEMVSLLELVIIELHGMDTI